MSSQNEKPTFHLGLTMAGAVTAGAYTAGVMDYLFEILENFEKAKEKGYLTKGKEFISKDDIPQHDVVIDVMGGASAGGMTTLLSAIYAMTGKIVPVKETPDKHAESNQAQNLLYKTWVTLSDEDKTTTFEKALHTDDIQKKEAVQSLFNSEFIDELAKEAFDKASLEASLADRPKYISEDLEILISHSMIDGIPIAVDFKWENSPDYTDENVKKIKHNTYEHFLISHFKMGKGHNNQYLNFDPQDEDSRSTMKYAGMATGAFPIGLVFRKLKDYPKEYLQAVIQRIISGKFSSNRTKVMDRIDQIVGLELKNNTFLTVDGGAVNNEPFGEVAAILKSKSQYPTQTNSEEYKDIALIMIDPFPDQITSSQDEEDSVPTEQNVLDIADIVPRIIKMLWNQAKVKRRDVFDATEESYNRSVIYPARWKSEPNEHNQFETVDHPLASSPVAAFGGLFSNSFREHDFYLGRHNARNFFRYYFSLPYENEDNCYPIHKGWDKEIVKQFLFQEKETEDGSPCRSFLPIIPDLSLLGLSEEEAKAERFDYFIKDMPKISPEKIWEMKPLLQKRVKAIVSHYSKAFSKQKPSVDLKKSSMPKDQQLVQQWLAKKQNKKKMSRLGKLVLYLIWLCKRKAIMSSISSYLLSQVIIDLASKGFLDVKDEG